MTVQEEGPEQNDKTRTLHVSVNSWGDWLLEKDDGPIPTRVEVKW